MKKTRVLSSALLRFGQTITFWTLIQHVKGQQLYLQTHAAKVGHGAVSTHRVGKDTEYALCGAAVYSISSNGAITCHFCQLLTP